MAKHESTDPPIVLPPLRPGGPHARSESGLESLSASKHAIRGMRDAGDWLERVVGAESYGAPRVFDLFTLLAITLAFALLFAVLRLFAPLLPGALDTVAMSLGAFVTGIAIFQLTMWEGKKPRLASLVAGPILWSLASAAFSFGQPSMLLNPALRVVVACTSLMGIPAGYLGGAMVAGVFLVADFFRKKYLRQPHAKVPPNDDQIFEKEEVTRTPHPD